MSPAISAAEIAGHVAWLRANVTQKVELASDSRRVKQGDVFFAYPGDASDGRRFIPQALERGAQAVLWDDRDFDWNRAWQVPNRGVSQLKAVAGPIADAWYAHPSATLFTVGITGTNGKTSCSQWVAQALNAAGMRCAVIGTLGTGFPGALMDTGYTTPDAVMLQRSLVELRRQAARAVALEVSSIGLDQGRVNGMRFDIAVLTNLTRDHLDYHGSMENYAAAKEVLFDWPGLKHAVLNLDDAMGRRMAKRLQARHADWRAAAQPGSASEPARVWTYSIEMGEGGEGVKGGDAVADAFANIRARNLRGTAHGMAFRAITPLGAIDIETNLIGTFNVSNALAVLGVLLAAGVGLAAAGRFVAALTPPPGRMQTVTEPGAPLAVVDYAHTPDALEKVLAALRPVCDARGGRLGVVFGCGGDRDPGKRSLMGQVAERLADVVIVTSDNPRSENPQVIIDMILAGIAERGPRLCVQPDRRAAIHMALSTAGAGDVVLIAGKGHEAYQEIAGIKHLFSDIDEARAALQTRAASLSKGHAC